MFGDIMGVSSSSLFTYSPFLPSPKLLFDIFPIIYNHLVVNLLNQTFIALSDPTRRLILDRLRDGPATVNQLAEPFGVSQQAISKHLACLERARLIEKRRQGRKHFCSLNPVALKEADDWMQGYRQFWDEAFNRLDVLLHDLQPQNRKENKHARKRKPAG